MSRKNEILDVVSLTKCVTMATAAEPGQITVEPNEKECSICHEHFTVPKLLRCGHLLCRQCLLTWIQSKPDAQCPLCCDVLVERDEEVEDIVDSFPTDLSMVAIVEADRLMTKPHQCCVCEDVAATSLCLSCSDAFCDMCTRVHKKQSVSKHHVVEDLSSLTLDKLSSHRPSVCPSHSDKQSELFCPSHDVAMCTVCFASRHRNCPDVSDLHQKTEEAHSELAALAKQLKTAKQQLDSAITKLDDHLLATEKKAHAAVAEMEVACDRLESAIKTYRRRMKQIAMESLTSITKAVHSGKACLLKRKGVVTTHESVMERTQAIKKHESFMTMTSTMKKRIGELDVRVELPESAVKIAAVSFQIDEATVKRLEQEIVNLARAEFVSEVSASILLPQPAARNLRFHDNHGTNIVLSNDKQTAERGGSGISDAIVIGCYPMVPNTLYEVQINTVTGTTTSSYVGLVSENPEGMALPSEPTQLTNAIPFCGSNVIVIEKGYRVSQTDSTVAKGLDSLKENSRVGLLVDKGRNLHFYLDGQDQGVVSPNIPDPCYPFFELYNCLKQVTGLPLRVIKE